MSEKLLLDTVFVQALLNRKDQYHPKAKELLAEIRRAPIVLITEAVILEIGNALRAVEHRNAAARYIKGCYENADRNVQVVPISTDLIRRSLDLFEDRNDKDWSLTDCISFRVMEDNEIRQAATADDHCRQAGFGALMS